MFTIRHGLLLAAPLALGGCLLDEPMLPDTLQFPPGLSITYGGKPAKLYGTEACVQGELAGHSCLIFPPNRPTSKAVIISGQRVQEIQVTAKRDPKNPTHFIVVDDQGRRLLRTTGNQDDMANIEIAY